MVTTDMTNSRHLMASQNGPLLALKNADKKPVYMLSTVNDNSVRQVSVLQKGTGIVEVMKPQMIIDYNMRMGGVDKTDQLIQTYKSARKTMKWTKKLVFYLLQHATLNAHYVHVTQNHGMQTYLQFMNQLLSEMLDRDWTLTDDLVRLQGRHFIYRIPSTSTRKYPSKMCRVCTKYENRQVPQRKETTFYCAQYPPQPALCPGDCFRRYHEEENYKIYTIECVKIIACFIQ